jgi:hypothetical protein
VTTRPPPLDHTAQVEADRALGRMLNEWRAMLDLANAAHRRGDKRAAERWQSVADQVAQKHQAVLRKRWAASWSLEDVG